MADSREGHIADRSEGYTVNRSEGCMADRSEGLLIDREGYVADRSEGYMLIGVCPMGQTSFRKMLLFVPRLIHAYHLSFRVTSFTPS